MTRDEITALTLLLLHTWNSPCTCMFYAKPNECSRCYALHRAEGEFPLVHEAFINTIEMMENKK